MRLTPSIAGLVLARTLTQAREEAERQRTADRTTLDRATEARIRALADDFPAVWSDPATADRDRKRMAQLLIEDVTLLKTDQLHVHMRFKGGADESLVLPLPKNAWHKRLTPPDVVTLPEGDAQIHASRYQLYLPSEEELREALVAERERLEQARRLTGPGAPGEDEGRGA